MQFTQIANTPPPTIRVQLVSPIFVGASQLMMFGFTGPQSLMTTAGVPIGGGAWSPIGTVGCPVRSEYNVVSMGVGVGYFLLNGRTAQGEEASMYSSPDGALWVQQSPVPYTPRHSACAVVFNGALYVYSGYSGLGEGGDLNDVWVCTGGELAWKQLAAHAAFPPTYNAGGGVVNGAMFLVGGIVDHIPTNQVWASHDGQTWVNLGPAPWPERYSPAVVTAGNALHVMGGAGNNGQVLSDIWMTTDGKSWTQVAGVEPGVDELVPTATSDGTTIYVAARSGIWAGRP